MLRLSVNHFCYYIFREQNLFIDFMPESTNKITLKVLTKRSQNTSQKCILILCTEFEFTIMDQHEPEKNTYIGVNTPNKLKEHNMFFDVQDLMLTCYARLFKVVCPLGCRNTSKLLNGQNAHFCLKPHRKIRSMNTYFCLYKISTKFTHIKHEKNRNITQLLGRYIFMTYLREKISKKVKILMKTKLYINLNKKSY